jgi:hypothetical protein
MRSSADDSGCDMMFASPEAPGRSEDLDRRIYDAPSFHGKVRNVCYCSCCRIGTCKAIGVDADPCLSRARQVTWTRSSHRASECALVSCTIECSAAVSASSGHGLGRPRVIEFYAFSSLLSKILTLHYSCLSGCTIPWNTTGANHGWLAYHSNCHRPRHAPY